VSAKKKQTGFKRVTLVIGRIKSETVREAVLEKIEVRGAE